MTDNFVPLPPRFPSTTEPFVPEPAVFPYDDAEWAAENLPLVRQAVAVMNMRTDQVRPFAAVIDGTAEPSADVITEVRRLAGHLGALKDACEAAAGRFEWASSQEQR